MKNGIRLLAIVIAVLAAVSNFQAQDEEICTDRGIIAGIETATNRFRVVFGRVTVRRPKDGSKPPTVVIWLREGRSTQRYVLEGSGTYCFEKSNLGGEITVDLNGQEEARRPIITSLPQQREDFEFTVAPARKEAPPGVISAKFPYERNGKNAKLFDRATNALAEEKPQKAIEYLTELLKADPADFGAAATIGSIYYRRKNYVEAENWFMRSVSIRPDFTPAWISLSQSQYAQQKYEAAIVSCKTVTRLDPNSAVAFYILGEAYLRTHKGNDAVKAFNEAIRLDPVVMAECHLILAELYDINGAKQLASKEYKEFLVKVPNHPQKDRFEQYIKDNP
ncbi:MAG TPA: tetratricopeptide repeat protein [Pyrinomonadaceae bacterium]